MKHLHLSIGPVQGFVTQSRRTRDLWGSSYLLSFLAAHAIQGATKKGGQLERPRMNNDPMLQWVAGRREGDPPILGSVPNHLVFGLKDDSDPEPIAAAAEQALQDAWHRVCGAVWSEYVSHVAPLGNGTEEIWKRQTTSFWEVVWVAGPANDPALLNRRKRWRTHWLPEEPGTKCTVMPDLQELSGHVRATDRARQDAFWNALREKTGELNLRDNERLCAVALVKRLYAHVSKQAIGWKLDVNHWPSTVDVAAVPWCEQILREAPQAAEAYAKAVDGSQEGACTGGVLSLLQQAPAATPTFLRLDANWFHASYVRENAGALLPQLKSLPGGQGGPPIYFALLLADGDSLGDKLVSLGAPKVSEVLEKFTRDVPGVVQRHRGVAVYAGGDDVLALLTLESALDCARELEHLYRKSFEPEEATLSAAVVFAHARDPLNRILEEAHRLLDEVAKDENGRSSLAAGVYRGATAVQWVTAWDRPSTGGARQQAVECLQRVQRELDPDRGRLSGSLIQDLRHLFSLLCGAAPLKPGTFASVGAGIDAAALVRGEIEHRLAHGERARASRPEDAVELAALVSEVLGQARNAAVRTGQVGIDGLMLAGFLAGGGREEEHRP